MAMVGEHALGKFRVLWDGKADEPRFTHTSIRFDDGTVISVVQGVVACAFRGTGSVAFTSDPYLNLDSGDDNLTIFKTEVWWADKSAPVSYEGQLLFPDDHSEASITHLLSPKPTLIKYYGLGLLGIRRAPDDGEDFPWDLESPITGTLADDTPLPRKVLVRV